MLQGIKKRGGAALLALLLCFTLLFCGCLEDIVISPAAPDGEIEGFASLSITNGESVTLTVGQTLQLTTDLPDSYKAQAVWTLWDSTAKAITLTADGQVTAVAEGEATVLVTCIAFTDTITVRVVSATTGDDTGGDTGGNTGGDTGGNTGGNTGGTPTDFYGDYVPAASYAEALERSARGELSGLPVVPDQAPTVSAYLPATEYGALIRNNTCYYPDANTYVVVDAWGNEVFRVYRGGGYITLEEVAAYVFAFGDVPANYTSSKNTRPTSSIWGEYLRLNHSKFSGNTSQYPYEPVLPRISGCGGDLQYYEIDIGTTGTDCDPKYTAALYNNGTRITRGAARIVYARFDKNGNSIIDVDEKFVFYTYNHYNDFQEYLNYYGGWGVMFGNITGGGKISSETNYNPTPYVPTVRGDILDYGQNAAAVAISVSVWALPTDPRRFFQTLVA